MPARPLNLFTLNNAAAYYAKEFMKPDAYDPRTPTKLVGGKNFVMQNFYNFRFKDEFTFMVERVTALMDQGYLAAWKKAQADTFEPRDDATHEALLAEWLAVNPAGEHLPGVIGKTEIGRRRVGKRVVAIEQRAPRTVGDRLRFRPGKLLEVRHRVVNDHWPVYAGEIEERAAESGVADPLPAGADPWPVSAVMATNPRIANVAAIAACDAIVDLLDGGSTAATIRGRTGSQPADPDASESGTLLFTLTMSDPAFGSASDANPGGRATASAITDDSSADATGTLGYCRCGATGSGADDLIDGEAGTSGADFNFNTLSIVSGATVSMSSFTVTVPES